MRRDTDTAATGIALTIPDDAPSMQIKQETTYRTRDLGLAAYLKMHGAQLVKVDGKSFVFVVNSTLTLREWELKYSNSNEHRHDIELVALRNLLTRST